VINISNFGSEGNPPWPQGGAAERLASVRPSVAGRAADRSAGAWTGSARARTRDAWTRTRDAWTRTRDAWTRTRDAWTRTRDAWTRTRDTWTRIGDTWTWIGHAVTIIGWVLAGWVSSIPGRLLDRLFEMNDAEAYWSGWQITKVHGGLGRQYRDPRFDTLAACSRCWGTGTRAGQPCSPCQGTGRVWIEDAGIDGTGSAEIEAEWLTGEAS